MEIKKFLKNYMILVGPIGNIMFFLQAHKIFMLKNSITTSLPGFSISLIALASWLAYGISIKDIPLIITNVIGLIGAALVLTLIFIYQ